MGKKSLLPGQFYPSKRKSQRSLKRNSPPNRVSSRLGGLFCSVDSSQHSLGHFTPLLPLALIVTAENHFVKGES
jgi:hypothetical protein